jgi:peptide/nickel transport system permease protein
MRRRRVTAIPQSLGVVILLAMLALCAVPRLFAPADPLATRPARRLQSPSVANPFGTDYLGRDILSRVIYGTRVSLVP